MAGTVTVSDITTTEGGRYAFTLTRTGGTAAFAVQYVTVDDTATAGDDYTAIAGEAFFGVGVDTVQVFFETVFDSILEPNETFFLNLSAPTNGAVIADAQGIATIENRLPPMMVSSEDIAVLEGDSGFTNAVFTITRSGRLDAFSINWTTEFATASPGVDYISASDTLNFAEGERTKTITVHIVGDTQYENPEHVIVRLYGATTAASVRDQNVITIVNDDMPPDDYAGNASTSGTVVVGGGLIGHIESAGDVDWFRVALTAHEAVTLAFSAFVSPAPYGQLINKQVELRDASGVLLARNYLFDSYLTYSPAATGDYYIAISEWLPQAGSYGLNALPTFTDGADVRLANQAAFFVAPGVWRLLGGDDTFVGTMAEDTIDGGAGSDFMRGEDGNDTYYADTYLDQAVELAGAGTDTVIASGNFILQPNVENLTLVGAAVGGLGNELANVITGNALGNGLAGGAGNDTIQAGDGDDSIDGQAGADSMLGGSGIDTYFVDDVGDTVVEGFNGGQYDTIWATVSLTLPENVEILILNGGILPIDGTGNDGAADSTPNLMLGNNAPNTLTTFGGDDIILGLDGNDVISAGGSSALGYDLIAGGRGADTLTGGSGHDYFTFTNIDEAGDRITDFTTTDPDLDIIDLRPLWQTFTNTAGITTSAQAVASGHLTYATFGADTQVFADSNGGLHNPGEQVLLVQLLNTNPGLAQILTLI